MKVFNRFCFKIPLDQRWQNEKYLDVIKNFDSGGFTVCCYGDKIKVSEKAINLITQRELKDTLMKSAADIVVCIVELVYEGKHITVKKEMEIHAPQIVYHYAETKLEDIALHRVMSAVQYIGHIAQSLRSSFPELSDIKVMAEDAFKKHLSQKDISEIAYNIKLMDGKKEIGNVYSGKMIYYNGMKIREIRTQLIEECSKTIINQIGSTVAENLLNHIISNLDTKELQKDFSVTVDPLETMRKIFKAFAVGLTVFLTFIFGPILSITSAGSLLYYVFYPVDLNDPKWRDECVHDIIASLEKKRKKIISETVSSVQNKFELMSKELETIAKETNFPSITYYNEALFKEHKRLKDICFSEMHNENLRQNVKKIIIGKRNGALQANMYVKKDKELFVEKPELINLQQIGQSTNEDRCIQKFIIEKRPRIEPQIRDKIKEVISKESQRLFRVHSNLSIIGPSPVKSSNDGKTIEVCPCIVFYCIGKDFIPIGEPLFPKTLGGIGIDVREGFFTPFICDRCSVGQYRTLSSGSHGFRASKTGNPSVHGFITAAHVVVNKDVLCRDIGFQKQHVKNTNLIVVAPSDLDSHFPEDQRIYGNMFAPIFSIDDDYLYSDVVKCGRTTSLTTGLIMNDGMECKYEDSLNNFFVILQNQYQIISNHDRTSFFKPGDSGSGVYIVQDGNYHPIGIAIASQNEDGEVCFVTPLKYILESLDLEMYPASMETES
ncbi:hypothetical protein KUTeg_009150 [Tegillarca granosa]|uniref:Uncharacterized protein n=1 Tax=Tegillarca granosa TaxID=220873 RepID=A0ABQ9F7Q9_TEGGR|nr:hypothetical protein KUTeg_009150 [Tegillarca granosa]